MLHSQAWCISANPWIRMCLMIRVLLLTQQCAMCRSPVMTLYTKMRRLWLWLRPQVRNHKCMLPLYLLVCKVS